MDLTAMKDTDHSDHQQGYLPVRCVKQLGISN